MGFLAVLVGCGDDVLLVEREVFDPPPDSTFGFLGYFNKDDGSTITTCGNCHVGKQSGWETTGHAGAWEGLQASGGAQGFCEGCHTVNENGNALTEAAGHNLVPDERYYDVQCESCHGPGLEHVENPDAFQPLASIEVGVDLGNGCGDCHAGTHHPFVDQWAESKHGSGGAMSYAGARDSCAPCHEGRVALEVKFGEHDDYVERDGLELQRISCAVCHDPHGSPNENNLRAPIDVATADNLCVTCHSRRGTPWSSHGPHSPQGLLVLGTNVGWIPPGFAYDTLSIISTHGSDANPKLCATCHVNIFEVTDAATGDHLFSSKGHSFEAIPCVDAEGLPVTGHNCGLTERTYAACTASGCHGSADAARSALTVTQIRLTSLLKQLWDDTDGNHHMDATDGGLLPQVVAMGDTSQLDPSTSEVTVAKGALWNSQLTHGREDLEFEDGEVFGIHFSSHRGSGRGAHNPFLLEALLIASIDAVADHYGLAPPPGLDRTLQMTPPPGLLLQ
jgi:predicted CXXCH cytochrome family protein